MLRLIEYQAQVSMLRLSARRRGGCSGSRLPVASTAPRAACVPLPIPSAVVGGHFFTEARLGSFSKRHGERRSRVPLKRDEMPQSLRSELWKVAFGAFSYLERMSSTDHYLGRTPDEQQVYDLLVSFWVNIVGIAPHEVPHPLPGVRRHAGPWFMEEATWLQIYDTLEFLVGIPPELYNSEDVANVFNDVLKSEQAAWSFVGNELMPLASEAEGAEVAKAMDTAPELVRKHLESALDALSARPQANVHVAIDQAISAVESMAKHCFPDDRKAQKAVYTGLRDKLIGKGVNQLFAKAMHDLYNYTSDEGGLRHGFKVGDDPSKHEAEARFFVVTCSAFVNYLMAVFPKAAQE